MEVVHVVSCIIFLLTVTASPEIPSKGKHMHMGDKSHSSLEDADMPRFAEPVANVTVSVGRDALLACVVENLKGYKVAWVRVDTQTILSIHHNVISQNNRISLTYNDHRSWYLHIKEVEESDRGWYMCQVNTDPMRSRKGYLQVVVPPMIVEGMTSNDLVVREGLNVTLMCKARGYPEPYVMWRREDGEEMLIGGEHVNVVDGELLHITKVSRLHMAAYLCVASNGVPPSISKRVHLRVQFPPMLSIPNQLEGAYIGQDVVLECHTEAYPASINYWTTERGDMIISDTSRAGDKYETTSTVNGYTKYMKLKIRNVGPNDFGTYRCVAKNSLGETDGNIKLDEMPAPTTAILSEMAMLNRSLDGKRRNKNKLDSNSLPDYGVEEWRDGAGNAGDNNQAPMRNPPDAFHNSAGALAQNNLVGVIIQAIKMQSLGIFKRLTNLRQTINECDDTTTTAAGTVATDDIKYTATLKTAIVTTGGNTKQNYVHKIQKLMATVLRTAMEKMIKSTVFILRQQQERKQQSRQRSKNLIIENEFKTFKHFSTQETYVSRHEKHGINFRRILRKSRLCYSHDKMMAMTTSTLQRQQQQQQDNSNFMVNLYVNNFQKHIKQQEILHKFNTIYVTHIFETTANSNHNNMFYNNCCNKLNIKLMANRIYWFIILLFITFILSLTLIINFLLPKSMVNPTNFLTSLYGRFLSQQMLMLLLQKYLRNIVNNILWHIDVIVKIVLKYLTIVYSTLSLNINSTNKTSAATTTTLSLTSSTTLATTLTKTSSSSFGSSLSLSTSTASASASSSALPCSTLLFCR
ncbi:Lachesin [Lucilia cuprina]|nr:Lachesin [Lucilia cuprina]